ncbi:MAG: GGDEF domain-containing protein [Candidatus Limnocylindrales bacterium]
MDPESISRILILAIVANLVIMILVIVPAVRHGRNRDLGKSDVSYVASNGATVSPTVLADRLASIAGPVTVAGPVTAAGPVQAATDPGTGSAPDPNDTPRPTIDASPGVPPTDMATDDAEARRTGPDDLQLARPRRFTLPADDDRAADAIEAFLSGSRRPDRERGDRRPGIDQADDGPEGLVDRVTGLESPYSWSRTIATEQTRSARYGRPATVVIAELDGLDILADRFGEIAADRLIPPVADALRRNARAADRVARLGRTRFGILLVETDEVRAINYVERVRAACDRWLEASAVAVRLSLGWACPAVDGDLAGAVRTAEERMHRERRRSAPWHPAPTEAEGPED